MTNDYWKKRAEEIAGIESQYADIIEQELLLEYEKSLESITRDIEAFYARYATTEGITMADARKQLDKSQLKGFRMSLEEFIRKARDNKDGKWERELESEYIRSRVSRLEPLKSQIENEITALGHTQNMITEKAMNITYADTFYRVVFNMNQGAGVELEFSQLNTDAVNKAVTRRWLDGNNFSERIWKDKDKLTRELKTALSQGIIRGDTPDRIINSFAKRMNVSRNNAAALIQTETSHIMNEAAFDSYKEFNILYYDVLGTLDLHTCSVCGGMDGKTFSVSERETGINTPPFHTRCRCTTVPHVDGKTGTRAARDTKTGKTIQIDANTTFEEWKKSLDIAYGEKYYETERRKVVNRRKDLQQYTRYKKVLGSENVPKSLVKFQNMKYNKIDEYDKLKKSYKTIGEINRKPWTDSFKDKAKQSYYDFRKENIEMSSHAISRFLSRKDGTNGISYNFDDMVKQCNMSANYMQTDGRPVKYYNQIAVVYNKENDTVVSIVNRKNPKKDWREI